MRKNTLGQIAFWSVLTALLSVALVLGVVFTASPGRRTVTHNAIASDSDWADGYTYEYDYEYDYGLEEEAESEWEDSAEVVEDTRVITESFSAAQSAEAVAPSSPPTTTASPSRGNGEIVFDQSYPLDGVEELQIQLTSDEADIFLADDGLIRVVQSGTNLAQERVVRVEQSGSRFTVTNYNQKNWNFRPQNVRSYVEIYLPEAYHGALGLDLTSGSIELHSDRQFRELLIDITSGSVRTANVQAADIEVDMTSGNVDLGAISSTSFELEATSGNLQIQSLSGSGGVDITSGTVNVNRLELTGPLALDLTSGNISVGLAGRPSLDFYAERTSGNINTYFDTVKSDKGRELSATVGEGPYQKVRVDMTSGTVNIHAVD